MPTINISDHRKEELIQFFRTFFNRIPITHPDISQDIIRILREQAIKDCQTGVLFTESGGGEMFEKYLAPFKKIAKNLKVTVKGTPEERANRQLEIYSSMEKSRKRANTAILQK